MTDTPIKHEMKLAAAQVAAGKQKPIGYGFIGGQKDLVVIKKSEWRSVMAQLRRKGYVIEKKSIGYDGFIDGVEVFQALPFSTGVYQVLADKGIFTDINPQEKQVVVND